MPLVTWETGTSGRGQRGKRGLEDAAADLAVQAAYAVDRAGPPNSQIGHVEWFLCVIRVSAPKGEKTIHPDTQFVRIFSQILTRQGRREAVKTCRHGCMGGKHVACACGGKRHIKGLTCFCHKRPNPFKNGQCGMTFIQVTGRPA